MGGKHSRNKGAAFERFIAKALRPFYPNAERLLEFQSSQAVGVDLRGTGPYRIQCKAYKEAVPMSKIKEISDGGIHILASKTDNEKPMITMYLDDWLQMMEAAHAINTEGEKT
jgi:hypothetical protein